MSVHPHVLRREPAPPADPALRNRLKALRAALEEGRLSRERLEALDAIVHCLADRAPLRETLERALFLLREPSGARSAFLLVPSNRPGRSAVEILHGLDEDADLRAFVVERIARLVASSGAPLLVRDARRELHVAEIVGFADRVGSLAAVPLGAGPRAAGALGLVAAPDQPGLAEADLAFLGVGGAMLHGILGETSSRKANLHLLARIVRPLTAALEARDAYTRGHSERVAKAALAVVHELEIAGVIEFSEEFRNTVRLAAFLHDIGKIGVSDTILHKPSELSADEFAEIKTHTLKGAQILEGLPELADVIPGVVSHHERWDGSGYPYGLKGPEIPLLGKVIGIADVLDAMTTDRPYMRGMPRDEVVRRIQALAGTKFDPEIVAALVAAHRNGLLEEVTREEETASVEGTDYGTIERIFSREIHDLPALPQIVTQVLERARDPKTPVREIVRLISRDQALVIRILRLVNSAYYGFSRKIATINVAVAILGYRAVQNLVLNVGVVGVFREMMRSKSERRLALFEHSMECAVIAKALATKLPALDCQADEAFTAGLLHDVGKIVLEQYAGDAAARVAALAAANGVSEIEAEAEILGVDHTAVGEWIAMRWNIPLRLREAILFHHRPFAALEKAPGVFPLVKLIALANRLQHLSRTAGGPEEIFAGVASSPLAEPGLTLDALAEILRVAEVEKAEFREILSGGEGRA